jgi:hypothetical protein
MMRSSGSWAWLIGILVVLALLASAGPVFR